MSKKVNNTVRMWHEAGYNIEKVGHSHTKTMAIELKLTFKNQTGKPVNFYEDRTKMRDLAKRQDFIVIPLTTDNGDGLAEVLLVNHKLIYKMAGTLREMWEKYNTGYWRLQGDKEYLRLLNRFSQLSTMLDDLYQLTQKMQGKSGGAHIELYHAGFISASGYHEFKMAITKMTQEMIELDKFEKKTMRLQENIAGLYA